MENGNENGISVKELSSLLDKMKKRLAVSNHSEQTIVNYVRLSRVFMQVYRQTPAGY